jgi:hypothetical protein
VAAAKPLFTPGSAHAQQDLFSMSVDGNMALLVSNFPGNMQQHNTRMAILSCTLPAYGYSQSSRKHKAGMPENSWLEQEPYQCNCDDRYVSRGRTGQVVVEVLDGALAGDNGLHEEAEHGEHSQAAVLDLLHAQLCKAVGVVSQAQGVKGLSGVQGVQTCTNEQHISWCKPAQCNIRTCKPCFLVCTAP